MWPRTCERSELSPFTATLSASSPLAGISLPARVAGLAKPRARTFLVKSLPYPAGYGSGLLDSIHDVGRKIVGERSILAYAAINLLGHIVFRVGVADRKVIFYRVVYQLGVSWQWLAGIYHFEKAK